MTRRVRRIRSSIASRNANAPEVFFAVEGRVQGVGFRYFTQKKAQEYGVTGWCRNTKDEKVEGEAQGNEEVLTKFFEDVDNGPRSARVTKVSQEERQLVDGENDFVVTR
ncbi:Ff.00g093240.m01.CDS01 [Fusarium sp. VM40]|nr:Ff.00g093240.m01.CDS01 [Fusarium sp. VM40]